MVERLLPDELILSLQNLIPCRELQIQQLCSLLDPRFASPPVLLVHGLEATGKSLTIINTIKSLGVPSAFAGSKECITARHLLERALAAAINALDGTEDGETMTSFDGRCDSISAFVVQLQYLLEGKGRFTLVFDGIDRQREAPPTLLPAIARLGEIIPNLTIILIVTSPRSGLLQLRGVPCIHFPTYTRAQSLSIVSKLPLPIYTTPDDQTTSSPSEHSASGENDSAWLWKRFCSAVWDSLGQAAARDVLSFRDVCERLWKPFVQPIVDGSYGTREFSKLMVKNRALFQGEAALRESIISMSPSPNIQPAKSQHTLPYYTKYLLSAAYLASYNPARQDLTFFTKASEKKRRKRGGGTAVSHHRPSKHRKIQRRLLGPQAFVLERLIAIFHAILPHSVASGSADIMTQVATLANLRLLAKTAGGGDILDGVTKWRVNVGWEYIQELARSLRFDIENYLVE